MTLLDIITTSLQMLERGTDSHTIDNYRSQFTKYANDAVSEILQRIKQQRCDVVDVADDDSFTIDDLERECIRVTKVTFNEDGEEKPLMFKQKPSGSGTFFLKYPPNVEHISSCNVYYRFFPKQMTATTDSPELPNYMHSAIPYYVVAMARENSDASNQQTSRAYIQQFNSKVMQFEREARGETTSFSLLYY